MKFLSMAVTCLFISQSLAQTQVKYSQLKKDIKEKQMSFKKAYRSSTNKDSILTSAREYLFNTATQQIFPSWYGTPWDFNGISQNPKEGKIACGYFVTNTLIDLGFKLPRYKWAQSIGEDYIVKLAPNDIQRFSGDDINTVKKALTKSGDGLYLVGLDNHVGYLVVEQDTFRFVHSNYYQPEIGVMSEEIDSGSPISDSEYRVIGKLFSDKMVENWIIGYAYK